jgi:hypothetical protein
MKEPAPLEAWVGKDHMLICSACAENWRQFVWCDVLERGATNVRFDATQGFIHAGGYTPPPWISGTRLFFG